MTAASEKATSGPDASQASEPSSIPQDPEGLGAQQATITAAMQAAEEAVASAVGNMAGGAIDGATSDAVSMAVRGMTDAQH